jgi:hypothetical protein
VYRHDLLASPPAADPEAWCRPLEAMEPELRSYREALRAGRLSALRLYPGEGRGYEVTAWGLRRVWRRSRPIATLLERCR